MKHPRLFASACCALTLVLPAQAAADQHFCAAIMTVAADVPLTFRRIAPPGATAEPTIHIPGFETCKVARGDNPNYSCVAKSKGVEIADDLRRCLHDWSRHTNPSAGVTVYMKGLAEIVLVQRQNGKREWSTELRLQRPQ